MNNWRVVVSDPSSPSPLLFASLVDLVRLSPDPTWPGVGRGGVWGGGQSQLFILDLNWMESSIMSSEESHGATSCCGSPSSSLPDLDSLVSFFVQQKVPPFLVEVGRVPKTQTSPCKEQLRRQKILSYNRAEKSLEELSRKFIDRYEGRLPITLELDKVVKQLNVERRRIYDILNIFSSLNVMKKDGKNNYCWRGLSKSIQTIVQLEQNGPHHKIPCHKKDDSLENLTGRFLQLLIFSDRALSLEEAARELIPCQDSKEAKAKVRRLYDIANIFKSIRLVQKVPLVGKRNGFLWLGTSEIAKIIAEKRQSVREQSESSPAKLEQWTPLPASPEQVHDSDAGRVNGEVTKAVDEWEEVGRVSGWTTLRRQFEDGGDQSFCHEFSVKPFMPAIISQTSILSSTTSLNDLIAQQ